MLCGILNVLLQFLSIIGFVLSPVSHLPHASHRMPVALPLQLIIGFESGIVVLWDLKSKKADYRYTYDEVGKSPRIIYFLSVILVPSKMLLSIFRKLEIKSYIHELHFIQLFKCACVSNFEFKRLYCSWQGLLFKGIGQIDLSSQE